MTAPEAPEWLRETITEHDDWKTLYVASRGFVDTCSCGVALNENSTTTSAELTTRRHHAHVAAVIWEATQVELSRAWREGKAAGHWEFSESHLRAHPTYIGKREAPIAPDPYRAADTEET